MAHAVIGVVIGAFCAAIALSLGAGFGWALVTYSTAGTASALVSALYCVMKQSKTKRQNRKSVSSGVTAR